MIKLIQNKATWTKSYIWLNQFKLKVTFASFKHTLWLYVHKAELVWCVDQHYSGLRMALALDGIIIIPAYHLKKYPLRFHFTRQGIRPQVGLVCENYLNCPPRLLYQQDCVFSKYIV